MMRFVGHEQSPLRRRLTRQNGLHALNLDATSGMSAAHRNVETEPIERRRGLINKLRPVSEPHDAPFRFRKMPRGEHRAHRPFSATGRAHDEDRACPL